MLRSSFFAFTTAQRALNVNQKALDVTGQNISNLNTIGYTRQRLDLYSTPAAGVGEKYGSKNSNNIGQGVQISQVRQIRDPFLDIRFRAEAPKMGELDGKLGVLQDLENVFDEIMTDGINGQFSDFVKQLQALSSKPSNPEFDSIARASAEMMTKLFSQYSKQLETTRNDQVYDLQNVAMKEVNGILESIAQLNKSIREVQITGSQPLELLDQRNSMIDELSTYLKIDVTMTPTEVSPGVVLDEMTINFKGATGNINLIDGTNHSSISAETNPATGIIEVSLTDSKGVKTNITNELDTGVLKGHLDMLNKKGEFDVPTNSTRGIGYYEGLLDNLANTFAEKLNDLNKVPNPDYDPADPTAHPEFLERPLFESAIPGEKISAKNIVISKGWRENEYGITATTVPDIGTGGSAGANENIEKMIALFNTKLEFTTDGTPPVALFKGTFQEYVSNMSNVLALDVKGTEKILKNYITVVEGISSLRDGVSAVSLDEEGINLLKYQKSYNAAARFMTTIDEALDVIINRMGTVGR